jgi:cysteinyl-tRNA synthetase
VKFSGFGKLAHLDMSKWPKKKRRFHLDTYPGMPWNKGDFVLWHGCKKNQKICWDTEIGRGRPAWNIQDAAMVTQHFGFTVDVVCGGIDNLVRHHDYTKAVIEAVSQKLFAKYWLHGGHLYVEGKKMSKSKGNVLYLEDLASKGYTKEQIRFFLIYRNYRKKLNFTWQNLEQASKELDQFRSSVQNLCKIKSKSSVKEAKTIAENLESVFQEFMDKDLDVPGAFNALKETVNQLQQFAQTSDLSENHAQEAVDAMRRIDSVLQVIF